MAKRKALKSKTAGSLKLTDDDSRVNGKMFINESLPKKNKELFRSVRVKCEEKNWHFFWTKRHL